MGFPRQEHQSRLPFPSLKDLPGPRTEASMGRWVIYHPRKQQLDSVSIVASSEKAPVKPFIKVVCLLCTYQMQLGV